MVDHHIFSFSKKGDDDGSKSDPIFWDMLDLIFTFIYLLGIYFDF